MRFTISQLQPLSSVASCQQGLKSKQKHTFKPKAAMTAYRLFDCLHQGSLGGCWEPGQGCVLKKGAALQYFCCVSSTFPSSCPSFLKFSSRLQPSSPFNYLRLSLLQSLVRDSCRSVKASRKATHCSQQVRVLSTVSPLTSINFFTCGEQE